VGVIILNSVKTLLTTGYGFEELNSRVSVFTGIKIKIGPGPGK
jgi:hypothetical protein